MNLATIAAKNSPSPRWGESRGEVPPLFLILHNSYFIAAIGSAKP